MKKLFVITLLAVSSVVSFAQSTLPADEQLVLQRYRVAKAQQATYTALRGCNDTNVLASVTAQLKAATPIVKTNAPTINRQPDSKTPTK